MCGTCVEHVWNMCGTRERTHASHCARALPPRQRGCMCPTRPADPSAGFPEGANVALRPRAGFSICEKRTAIPIAPPPRPSDHGFLFLPIRLAFPFSHSTLPFPIPVSLCPTSYHPLPPRNFPSRLKALAPQLLRRGPHSLLTLSFQTFERMPCRVVIGCCLIGEPVVLLLYLITFTCENVRLLGPMLSNSIVF